VLAERCTQLVTAINDPARGASALNSYVIRRPGDDRVVVVDSGPLDETRLTELASHGRVGLILLTHSHPTHAESAWVLGDRTGAAVRAADPAVCIGEGSLWHHEVIEFAGTLIVVVRTPGHSDDSVCLHLPDDRDLVYQGAGSILTGDTLLVRGEDVVSFPEGDLGARRASLSVLARSGPLIVLPGHGEPAADLVQPVRSCSERDERQNDAVMRAARVASGPSGIGVVSVEHVTALVRAEAADPGRAATEDAVAARLAYVFGIRTSAQG
jgi:glyoxylase-like metal-dependent hydrolase (beta-lactamase superfamily II)